MKLVYTLPALLLLAACSRTPAPARLEADDPVVAACRVEARNSPTIRDVSRQMNQENATQVDRVNALRAEAQERALDECLRSRGVRRGGGVERVRPPGFI